MYTTEQKTINELIIINIHLFTNRNNFSGENIYEIALSNTL